MIFTSISEEEDVKNTATHNIAIIMRESQIENTNQIYKYYLDRLNDKFRGIGCVGYGVLYGGKKPTAKVMLEETKNLVAILDHLNITEVLCVDSHYFKYLTKVRNVELNTGYAIPLKKSKHISVIHCPHYSQINYNTETLGKIDTSLSTLESKLDGSYVAIGTDIVKDATYCKSLLSIKENLEKLHQYPILSIDIESYSLQVDKSLIATIAFSWDKHSGIAINIDHEDKGYKEEAYKLLKDFFIEYEGKSLYHNYNFDVKVIIYELFMESIMDTEGLLYGVDVLTRDIEDSLVLAYLAKNTAGGNKLSLKHLAQEFAGNYGVENIDDISLIDNQTLLRYNLVDTLSTMYVYEKYLPIVKDFGLYDLYKGYMRDTQNLIIELELTGMPLDMDRVLEVEKELISIIDINQSKIQNSRIVNNFKFYLQDINRTKANKKLKKKVKPYSDFKLTFNSSSGKQLATLLYEFLGLPVTNLTATGNPSTDGSTLKTLSKRISNGVDEYSDISGDDREELVSFLASVTHIARASKILSTYVGAFKSKSILHDDVWYLHGNFLATGTQSMRLSSRNPSLQTLPSGSTYGKMIKSCFKPPKGKVILSSDYNALESRIAALLTLDKNSLSVYTDGYDSHSLASFFYFRDQMPDIAEELQGYFD